LPVENWLLGELVNCLNRLTGTNAKLVYRVNGSIVHSLGDYRLPTKDFGLSDWLIAAKRQTPSAIRIPPKTKQAAKMAARFKL